MIPPLFITARFRTGSTMLWNLFHILPDAQAYYEPLHDSLVYYLQYPIQPQKSHLFVKSYFDEYSAAPQALALHRAEFAHHRLYLEAGDDYLELRDYIQALVDSVQPPREAVLQFNRIDFRLPWIKKNFPEALLLHLTRNPRASWYSALSTNGLDVDSNIDADLYDMTTWSRDLYKQFPFLASPHIEHAYQRHYYLWKLSDLAGKRLSHLSIAYEDILAEPTPYITRILKFAELFSDENLELCLKYVESKPERAWQQDRTDAWFLDLEQKCEAVLDELGLNADFALIPLSEIQQRSEKYQTMLNDPVNERWANINFKQTVVHSKNDIFELNWYAERLRSENEKIKADLIQSKELESIRLELNRSNDALRSTLMDNEHLQNELHLVYNSRSWRITAPFRNLLDFARAKRARLKINPHISNSFKVKNALKESAQGASTMFTNSTDEKHFLNLFKSKVKKRK